MSICNKCKQLKTISLCTDILVIGYAGDYNFNTPFVVYFKSLATDRIYSQRVTSDDNAMITLTFNDGFPLGEGSAYEMWINQPGDSIDTQLDLIISDTVINCATLEVTTVFDFYYDENVNFDSQTLELL